MVSVVSVSLFACTAGELSGPGTADPTDPLTGEGSPPAEETPVPPGDDDGSQPGEDSDTPGNVTPNTTNGQGGPTGLVELNSTAGLRYWVNAPESPPEAAHGLLVLLHGSGASNYENFMTIMQGVATDLDLIPVSVLAPNGKGWNEGGNAAQTDAANLLNELIQSELFSQYNIDTSRIVFSGQSSGGGFLSTHFVPLHSATYSGGALLQCGAAPPAVAFAPSDATKQKFRLHFEITTGDTIWPESYAAAVDVYAAAGMVLTKDDTKPGGHCAFDQSQVIRDHIQFILQP